MSATSTSSPKRAAAPGEAIAAAVGSPPSATARTASDVVDAPMRSKRPFRKRRHCASATGCE